MQIMIEFFAVSFLFFTTAAVLFAKCRRIGD